MAHRAGRQGDQDGQESDIREGEQGPESSLAFLWGGMGEAGQAH